MNKLLVCADLHLKYKESLGDERKKFKQNKLSNLIQIVCKSPDIIGFCILGDLFDQPNPNEELRGDFFRIIQPLFYYNKYFIFSAGNHDSTATHHCLSGEKNIPFELIRIHTGTEIKTLNVPNFENIVVAPWYASLNQEEFYEKCKGKNVIGHMEIQGGCMNNGRLCDKGIMPHILKANNTKVLSGHFHKLQDEEQFSYLGSLYRGNFGEADYDTCYGLLDENFNLTRVMTQDWRFITINETDENWKQDYSHLKDEPVAIRFMTKKSIRNGIYLNNNTILSELKKLGFGNIIHFKKQILSERVIVEKNDVLLNDNIVDSFIKFSKDNGFSDVEERYLKKWLQDANFEYSSN